MRKSRSLAAALLAGWILWAYGADGWAPVRGYGGFPDCDTGRIVARTFLDRMRAPGPRLFGAPARDANIYVQLPGAGRGQLRVQRNWHYFSCFPSSIDPRGRGAE